MPASKQVDTAKIAATVTRATTVMASARALIVGQTDAQKEAVRKALEADNVTDDNFVDIAMAALDGVNTELVNEVDTLAKAITDNTPPPTP